MLRALAMVALPLGWGAIMWVEAHAQVGGTVVDATTDRPLAAAVITADGRFHALTDGDGRFSLEVDADDVMILVRRIGFTPERFRVLLSGTPINVRVALTPAPVTLDPVEVEARSTVPSHLRGFEERRRLGFGHFITAEALEARPSARMSDFLRVVPGIYLVPNSRTGETVFMSRRAVSMGRSCGSRLYVDGVLVHAEGVDWLEPTMIAGIEVYTGPSQAPIRYSGIGGCGAIVLVWTK